MVLGSLLVVFDSGMGVQLATEPWRFFIVALLGGGVACTAGLWDDLRRLPPVAKRVAQSPPAPGIYLTAILLATLGSSLAFAPPATVMGIAVAGVGISLVLLLHGMRQLQYHEYAEARAVLVWGALQVRRINRPYGAKWVARILDPTIERWMVEQELMQEIPDARHAVAGAGWIGVGGRKIFSRPGGGAAVREAAGSTPLRRASFWGGRGGENKGWLAWNHI